MNAYEIADELDGRLDHKAANMLRQQADRIAELEKQLDTHFKNGFEAGKLEGWKAHKYHSTPQTKPLSDEEMKELINNFPIIFSPQDLLTFAREIEKRHGIK